MQALVELGPARLAVQFPELIRPVRESASCRLLRSAEFLGGPFVLKGVVLVAERSVSQRPPQVGIRRNWIKPDRFRVFGDGLFALALLEVRRRPVIVFGECGVRTQWRRELRWRPEFLRKLFAATDATAIRPALSQHRSTVGTGLWSHAWNRK